jgi:2'-hydroxyisoflavone reductase
VDVLVLGGSVFVGRNAVAEALAAGHRVTVFNRGRSGRPPQGASVIRGDRTDPTDLAQLAGRQFDLVLDTSGYVPVDVARAARLLAGSAAHYAFVSTVNVFPGWPVAEDYHSGGVYDADPDAREAPADLPDSARYGWLKVGCELAVAAAFGEQRCSILRPATICGPHDSAVARLPWWLHRVARGGDVLVPGSPDDMISLLDARDLTQLALRRVPGVHELAGPPTTRAELMATCRRVTGSDARWCYVEDAWLTTQDVEPWTELPLWAPNAPSLFRHSPSPALTTRPLAETVTDTWAWQQAVPGGWRPSPRTPGLDPEKEALLAARLPPEHP